MHRNLASMLAAGALAAVLAAAQQSWADTSPEDRAAADALFREGRALVKQGKFAEGCVKLAASQKLDPATGSLLALGDCYELNGQTASAWTTFNQARAFARSKNDGPRVDEAEKRANLLEPKLSKLVIAVPDEVRVAGLDVHRNGKAIEAALFGSAIPVDPGEQTIEVTAPGKRDWRTTVTVEPRPGVTTVQVSPLADGASAQATSGSVPAKPSSSAVPERPASSWSTQRTIGIVLGGAGIAGVVVGAVFGGLTFSKTGEVKDKKLCTGDDPLYCNADGLRLQDEANVTANVSNVAFAVGGAALVAGVVVFLTAPSPAPAKAGGIRIEVGPKAGPGMAGLAVRGAW